LPKQDQPELFNPGEKPFISHEWELFREEKAPIPLFVNRSRQTAPSYSYYDRSISSATRGLPLYETRICFRQTFSSLLSPDLF
jgi:hypothetical protein